MGKFIDLTGIKFGLLTVVNCSGRDLWNQATWNCICDCGEEVVIRGYCLRSGKTSHCGCNRANKLPDGEAGLNAVYSGYGSSAKKRGYSFDISKEQFFELSQKPCYYCGKSPSMEKLGYSSVFVYSGLDRFNNNEGYTYDNLVSCCWECNHMKGTLSGNEYIEKIYKIVEYLKTKSDVIEHR